MGVRRNSIHGTCVMLFVLVGATAADHTAERMEKRCRQYAESVFDLVVDPILLPGTRPKKVDTCTISTQTTIVGGKKANPQEFPHMALIGYGSRPILWRCGGSLISEQWVLSAAHCAHGTDFQADYALLGDLDISSKEDRARPETYRIVERVIHPNYVLPKAYNDIALFKLDRIVKFNRFIRPICFYGLPSSENDDVTASGWGATAFGSRGSSYLQKVGLRIIENDECRSKYPPDARGLRRILPNGVSNESQICAWADGKDSCQGDSGGPLQQVLTDPYCMYNIVGVTSIGNRCGGKLPGIYTLVDRYLPWIESHVWPETNAVESTEENTPTPVETTTMASDLSGVV